MVYNNLHCQDDKLFGNCCQNNLQNFIPSVLVDKKNVDAQDWMNIRTDSTVKLDSAKASYNYLKTTNSNTKQVHNNVK